MSNAIKLPQNLEGLKPVLILPLLSTLVVSLLASQVYGPMAAVMAAGMTPPLGPVAAADLPQSQEVDQRAA